MRNVTYFKHNGFSLLWTVTYCTIDNKYFIHTVLPVLLGECLQMNGLHWESATRQVYSPADLLTSDKPQFCSSFKRIPRWPPLILLRCRRCDNPEEQKLTKGDTRGSPQNNSPLRLRIGTAKRIKMTPLHIKQISLKPLATVGSCEATINVRTTTTATFYVDDGETCDFILCWTNLPGSPADDCSAPCEQ